MKPDNTHRFMTGSLVFVPFSKGTGLPGDQFTYLACTFIAIPLVLFMRVCLPVGSASPTTRHLYWLIWGFIMAYIQFGTVYIINTMSMITLTYILIKTKIKHFQHINLLICMIHLAVAFYQRPEFKDLAVHWAWALSNVVMKMTHLAYAVQDGTVPSLQGSLRTKHVLKEDPTIIQLLSYNFAPNVVNLFQYFDDHLYFMEADQRPKSWTRVLKQLLKFLAFITTYMTTEKYLSDARLLDAEFINSHSWIYVALYGHFSIFIFTRSMIFSSWTLCMLCDAAAGIGYYTEGGKDVMENKKVVLRDSLKSVNAQQIINTWNLKVSGWIRHVCYERWPRSLRTSASFMLSSIWHGVTPGNLVTFSGWWVYVESHRRLKKLTRNDKGLYESTAFLAMSWFTSQFLMCYVSVPFRLETFTQIWTFFRATHFWGWIVLAVPFVCQRSWFVSEQLEDDKSK